MSVPSPSTHAIYHCLKHVTEQLILGTRTQVVMGRKGVTVGRTRGAAAVFSVKNSTAYQAFMTAGSVKDLACSNINEYLMDKLAYVCVTVKLLHIVLFASRQCKKRM